MKSPKADTAPLAVVIAKPVKVPALKTGDDAESAARLDALFEQAGKAIRVIVALGLYAHEIKAHLPHGQFGKWVEAHCKKGSYRQLRAHMQIADGVLEKCGVKINAYVKMADSAILPPGGDLLLLDEGKVPALARAMREKMLALIDGKTQTQLFLEFKQADEDEDVLKKKRGRLKGQGGASAAQRAKAKAKLEAAEVEAMELWVEEAEQTIYDNADDLHWGRIADAKAEQLLKALETGADYLRALIARRKTGREVAP